MNWTMVNSYVFKFQSDNEECPRKVPLSLMKAPIELKICQ